MRYIFCLYWGVAYSSIAPENVREGNFIVGKHLDSSASWHLFEASKEEASKNKEQFVIKYMHNCFRGRNYGLAQVHPALSEFNMGEALKSTGVVETTVLLGPDRVMDDKIKFAEWEKQDYKTCSQMHGSIKFVVFKASGPAVACAVDVSTKLAQFMEFGIQLIKAVEAVHTKGYIHGDIHRDSVHFKIPSSEHILGKDPIVLSDLGRAAEWKNLNRRMDQDGGITQLNRAVLSVWELQGFQRNRRDDVYRAIETLADLLARGQIIDGLSEVKDASQIMIYKRNGSIFTKTIYKKTLFEDIAGWNESVTEILTPMLEKVLKLGRTTIPDYAGVIEAFQAVLTQLTH